MMNLPGLKKRWGERVKRRRGESVKGRKGDGAIK